MTKSPAFQFYPKDWLSSLNITLMTAEQEGAYLRLLCYCWDSGDCSLPNDDEQLIKMSRVSKGGWEMVRKCFIPHPEKEGFLTNKRMLEELEQQRSWKVKSSIGGKKSAQKRAENKEHSKGGWEMVATKSNPATASATASATSKEEEKKESKATRGSRFTIAELPEDWKLFCTQERLDLDPNALFAEFRDYWISVPGKAGVKLDWFATWRNRVRDKRPSGGRAPLPSNPPRSPNFRAGARTV